LFQFKARRFRLRVGAHWLHKMELLNIITARAIWLLDLVEVNPKGKSLEPDFFKWIKDTYGLEKDNASPAQLTPQGWVFKKGHFGDVGVEFSIFNDGLVAHTQSSTRDAEAFLENAVEASGREFGLSFKPSMVRRKLYLSEMNVYSRKTLSGMRPQLAEVAARISAAIPGDTPIQFEAGGLSFWPDLSAPPFIAAFGLERKVNTPLHENKYYSRAPLHTDDHLVILNTIESLLMT
jgi:hypothetical protein